MQISVLKNKNYLVSTTKSERPTIAAHFPKNPRFNGILDLTECRYIRNSAYNGFSQITAFRGQRSPGNTVFSVKKKKITRQVAAAPINHPELALSKPRRSCRSCRSCRSHVVVVPQYESLETEGPNCTCACTCTCDRKIDRSKNTSHFEPGAVECNTTARILFGSAEA